MTEITRVPLQPLAKGSLAKLWLGVAGAVALAAGIAYAAMPAGLSVEVVEAGTGELPGEDDVFFVHYVGKFTDGEVFDEAQEGPWPVPGILPDGVAMVAEGVIPGLGEALMQMQKGGSYVVEIPSDLAYGAEPPPGAPIPPNADLVFEVQVIDILPRAEAEAKLMQMQEMMAQMQAEAGGEGAPGDPGAAPAPAPAPAPGQ